MVVNSATKNCNTGPAVNDLWPKGPNSLSSLLRVMLRWKRYPTALVWDMSKVYHSIHTSVKEKFLRLIVWGFGKLEKNWSTWGFDRIAFGGVPARVGGLLGWFLTSLCSPAVHQMVVGHRPTKLEIIIANHQACVLQLSQLRDRRKQVGLQTRN